MNLWRFTAFRGSSKLCCCRFLSSSIRDVQQEPTGRDGFGLIEDVL